MRGHSAYVFHGVGWNDCFTLFDPGDLLDDYMVEPVLRAVLAVFAIWRLQSEPQLELIGLRVS